MKGLNKFLAAVMVLGLVMSFVGTSFAADDAPDAVQYLNVGLDAEPGTLNRLVDTSTYSWTIITNTQEPLVRIHRGEYIGAGAESWQISDDGLTYTFKLRPNMWSDGKPVTAEDYVYNLRMMADPKTAYPYAADMYCLKNYEAINTGKMPVDQLGARAVDDHTLVIELEYVNPALFSAITFYPLRQDVYEKHGDLYGTEASTLVFCGPFILDEWVHNTRLHLVKNPNYWDADTVRLSELTFHIVAENTARYNMIDNGGFDLGGVVDREYIEHFKTREDLVGRTFVNARTNLGVFNMQDPVMKNKNVRLAISLAWPREETSEVLWNGMLQGAWGFLPPPMMEDGRSVRDATGNPLKKFFDTKPDIKAILSEGLKELGMDPDPAKFSFTLYLAGTSARFHEMGEYWQQKLQEALGCTVVLRYDEWAVFQDNRKRGDYQVSYLSWGSGGMDSTYLLNIFTKKSNAIGAYYDNTEYDMMVSAVQKELDPAMRLKMFAELDNKLVFEDVVCAPVVHAGGINFAYNYVKNVDLHPFNSVGYKYYYTSGRP